MADDSSASQEGRTGSNGVATPRVTIEQPKSSVRRGKDVNGKEWETEMHNIYGYIRGTESVDGDYIDIFLSDNPTEGNVFVIDHGYS